MAEDNDKNDSKESSQQLDSKEELAYSLSNLRKCIPLMGKYCIPTTPMHYAVWYAYVAQTDPVIIKEIDEAIKETGFCTKVTSEMLYNKHLASKAERESIMLKQSLESMVHDLVSSVDDTIAQTTNFNNMIDRHFTRLSELDNQKLSIEDTMKLVRSIVQNAQEIRESSDEFSAKLAQAQNEIKKLKQELNIVKVETTTDALTGLFNRRALDNDLKHFVDANLPFSLIMIDLDHFKNINDTYGHRIGDMVLKAAAKVLEDRTNGGTGRAYRYGGEELVVILRDKPLYIARKFADVCRTDIEKISVKSRTQNKNKTLLSIVTASFGVASYEKGDTVYKIVDKADMQLYQAKKLGRNRVMPMCL